MPRFAFIQEYIEHRSPQMCESYVLGGKPQYQIASLEADAGLALPAELKEFYEFAYGGRLGGYKLLTIPDIVSMLGEIHERYAGTPIPDSILPFAYLIDVGDFIILDIARATAEGTLVLDGFHELSPEQWKGICYGLETWLREMVASEFEPFWLEGGGYPPFRRL
ncbi:MAG: SMI1/KNR4 family protein [Anaerolineae bacterium]